MKCRWIFYFVLVLGVIPSCNKEDDASRQDLLEAGHPRILLLENEEQEIRDLINSDEIWKKIHFTILEESGNILRKPILERVMVGRRLLATSREFLRRVFFLSYNYRMTGEERFLQRAEQEMSAVARFQDWNPSHFLDVAEMTAGMAIGYDWLFAELSADSRTLIREAILNKGIKPSQSNDHNSWLRSRNNWNQVCNTGMVFGALAIQEDYPDLASEIIDRAFETILLPMDEYEPDGAYPEGYGYWGYGTTYNVLFLSAVEGALGTDRGLTSNTGFLHTGHFLKHMVGPSGASFNWGDNTTNTNLKTAMFWMAQKTQDPSILWTEKQFLEIDDFSKFRWIGSLPAVLIWAKEIEISQISEPKEKFWIGQGASPVAMMRTSWTDPDAVYLGFKAGSPSVNHGHMDIGSFVMEAEGVRWAADLGRQDYESLESLGMKIFGKTQDAQRWTIFRMNTYSHNVLIVNDQQQRVDGFATIERSSDDESFMFAISDVSTVYNGQLKQAVRGVGVKDGSYTIVRDEIETLDQPTSIRWNMVTPAEVDLGAKEATLTSQGKTLLLKVQGPDNLSMKTWSTAPTNNYDAENPGTIMVGFECELPANSSEVFEVMLVPGSEIDNATFTNLPLSEWK